jgi:hypothetical protein
VGPGEVLELLKRFEVKEVPALLVLDRRETVVHRWEGEGKIPAGVWAAVEALVRRLDKREEEDQKALREGQALASAGDAEGAYRKVAALMESERTSPEVLAGARDLEKALAARLRRALLETLGREGIDRDEKVVRELEELAASTAHRRARLEIEAETARLRARKIGATN